MDNTFIFTEIVNCGKIGKIALDSFHKYHNYKVHIYGTKEDFEYIDTHPNNVFIEIEANILNAFKYGHRGTAMLWEKAILETEHNQIIHFDSDTIFRENIIDEILSIAKDYDIIGPIRNYHHNPCKRDDVRHLADLCQTNCILFKKDKINLQKSVFKISDLNPSFVFKYIKYQIKKLLGKVPLSEFAQKIYGSYPLYRFKTLDFFDQVMFDMIRNGARIYHLSENEVGGCDKYGKRDNKFTNINNFPTPYKIDFGNKLVHFSCVGSGMNFYNNREAVKNVSESYVHCALDRYALFCKIFYNKDIPGIPLDKYQDIINIKNWY